MKDNVVRKRRPTPSTQKARAQAPSLPTAENLPLGESTGGTSGHANTQRKNPQTREDRLLDLMLRNVGFMIDAKFSSIEERLLSERLWRPPLAKGQDVRNKGE